MGMRGKCLCGAVRFTAEEVETGAHCCHCSMCRSWSGGPALSVGVGTVTFDGEENITRYQSSAWAERGFCGKCGSNLFFKVKDPEQYIMWLGVFEDLTPFHLEGEIYIDDKPAAYALAGDHPRMTGAEFLASIGLSPPSA
jgi:hypothetical protein